LIQASLRARSERSFSRAPSKTFALTKATVKIPMRAMINKNAEEYKRSIFPFTFICFIAAPLPSMMVLVNG
jgi:hypothetical protein